MLRKMPRKADQFTGQGNDLPQQRLIRIKPGLAQVHGRDLRIPPLHHLRQRPCPLLGQAECPRQVMQGAAAAIADDGGRQCRPFATVLAVQVLDDLLAPLVLEVDIDVRRLGPFAGDEPLHQQRIQPLADGGDMQAVAHQRIGRRTAALREDAAAVRIGHDVIHRQEVRLVAQFRDECQFALDDLARLRRRTLGQRSSTPRSTSLRSQLTGVSPSGTSSLGYS